MEDQQRNKWYQVWFDSPYYHLLYEHRGVEEASDLLDRLAQRLGIAPPAQVLDLACGRGRHSTYLHSKGYEVLGIDLSPANIAFAERSIKPGLRFAVHDMRQVWEPAAFDLVLNMFTSFGYFESAKEDMQVLSSVHENLKLSGVFVLDFLNALNVPERESPQEVVNKDNVEFRTKRFVENDTIVKQIEVYDGDDLYHFEEQVKAFNIYELISMLEVSGFQVKEVFGNYALDPFVGESSDRVILVSVK